MSDDKSNWTDAQWEAHFATQRAARKAEDKARRERMAVRKASAKVEREAKAAARAKSAAIAAANKQTGTCQVCAGTFKIVRGKISLHGYNRPGDGIIHGRCPGAQELPYEESRTALGRYIGVCKKKRDNLEESLQYWDSEPEEISGYDYNGRGTENLKKYKRGEVGYLSALESHQGDIKNRIYRVEREIKRQQGRYESWIDQSTVPTNRTPEQGSATLGVMLGGAIVGGAIWFGAKRGRSSR